MKLSCWLPYSWENQCCPVHMTHDSTMTTTAPVLRNRSRGWFRKQASGPLHNKHLRHTTTEKYENNGKGGYFRFDDNMSYRYILSITLLKWASWKRAGWGKFIGTHFAATQAMRSVLTLPGRLFHGPTRATSGGCFMLRSEPIRNVEQTICPGDWFTATEVFHQHANTDVPVEWKMIYHWNNRNAYNQVTQKLI